MYFVLQTILPKIKNKRKIRNNETFRSNHELGKITQKSQKKEVSNVYIKIGLTSI